MIHPSIIITLSLLLSYYNFPTIMVGFALVPSQIPGVKHTTSSRQRHQKQKQNDATAASTTLSQSRSDTAPDHDDETDSEAGDKVVYRPEISRREVDYDYDSSTTPSAASTSSSSHKKKKNTRTTSTNKKTIISIPRTGNLPDVHWRAISMSHLRSHPNFQPLPPPSMIHSIPTREHVRYFRQDSWQWDYLHVGRCTTSQCSAALGFLEPKAADYLGIPKSLQRGGGSAWERLRQVPEHDQSLQSLERILCEGRSTTSHNNDKMAVGSWRPGAKESDRLWMPASKLRTIKGMHPYPFSAKYMPTLTNDELYQRKVHVKEHHQSPSPMKTRMLWGNAQEATSILTALNYFCGIDSDTVIHEVGMCGAKFDDEEVDTDSSLLNGVKIGASPDAIIVHGNGTVEVLEVKNHCPFVWNRITPHSSNSTIRNNNNRNRRQTAERKHKNKSEEHRLKEKGLPKHYLIRDFQLERRIPPVYIPQLMMEILCVGDSVNLDGSTNKSNLHANTTTSSSSPPICTSAIMVRQTATKGAILLRLNRDEEWIQEMKYWLGKFKVKYVDTDRIPDDNFFWSDDPNSRYRKFLKRTKELSESVEQVAFIEHGRIQRMVLDRGIGRGEVPLFLDRVDEYTE